MMQHRFLESHLQQNDAELLLCAKLGSERRNRAVPELGVHLVPIDSAAGGETLSKIAEGLTGETGEQQGRDVNEGHDGGSGGEGGLGPWQRTVVF